MFLNVSFCYSLSSHGKFFAANPEIVEYDHHNGILNFIQIRSARTKERKKERKKEREERKKERKKGKKERNKAVHKAASVTCGWALKSALLSPLNA